MSASHREQIAIDPSHAHTTTNACGTQRGVPLSGLSTRGKTEPAAPRPDDLAEQPQLPRQTRQKEAKEFPLEILPPSNGKPAPIALIDINLVRTDDNQPRQFFDEEAIGRLAMTMKPGEENPKVPIELMPNANGDGYRLLTGEMRLRACKAAG